MKGIEGKTAIVSGGATSIGAAIVRAFRAYGAYAVIADIADGPGAALADELGPAALFHHTDVTRDDQIAACVAQAVARFRGVDFLVNGAVTYLDNGLESSRAEWLEALNVNRVGGAIFVAAAAPEMK